MVWPGIWCGMVELSTHLVQFIGYSEILYFVIVDFLIVKLMSNIYYAHSELCLDTHDYTLFCFYI